MKEVMAELIKYILRDIGWTILSLLLFYGIALICFCVDPIFEMFLGDKFSNSYPLFGALVLTILFFGAYLYFFAQLFILLNNRYVKELLLYIPLGLTILAGIDGVYNVISDRDFFDSELTRNSIVHNIRTCFIFICFWVLNYKFIISRALLNK